MVNPKRNVDYDRIQDYAEGRIDLTDDPELFGLIMNLPIIREYQNRNSQLKSIVANMQEAFRFLESGADTFCSMWDNFKEAQHQWPVNTNV